MNLNRTKSIFGRRNGILIWTLVFLFAGVSGEASAQPIKTKYGKSGGSENLLSVNGTSAFIRLVEQRGFTTATRNRLTPETEKYDTIIWFVSDQDNINSSTEEHLEYWIQGDDRLLIIVNRDFDAAVFYWEKQLATASAENKELIKRQLANAKFEERQIKREDIQSYWFDFETSQTRKRVEKFRGPWSRHFDNKAAEIFLQSKILPSSSVFSPEYSTGNLLESQDGESIIMEVEVDEYYENRVIVVANGSFLLNMPMANPAHRDLATQLADQCVGKVLVLESSVEGINVSDNQPDDAEKTFWSWVQREPMNIIVPQMLLLCVVYLFAFYPTHGRPKKIKEKTNADFSYHVEALGELYQRSGDEKFAINLIKSYQAVAKKENPAESPVTPKEKDKNDPSR